MLKPDEFEQYDQENPGIWAMFERFAMQALAHRKHVGAKFIFERMRWETMVRAQDGLLKLNNNFTSGYARKFMKLHPEFDKPFALRRSVNDAPKRGELF